MQEIYLPWPFDCMGFINEQNEIFIQLGTELLFLCDLSPLVKKDTD